MAEKQFDIKYAIEQFKKRKEENDGHQRDNATLPAGSPMYYYCRYCGIHTETLPETHMSTPKRVCDPCVVLKDNGFDFK